MHIEGLRALYSLRNAIQMIKLRRMSWAAHVTGMGGKIHEQMPLLGNLKVGAYLIHLRIDWKMILMISMKYEEET